MVVLVLFVSDNNAHKLNYEYLNNYNHQVQTRENYFSKDTNYNDPDNYENSDIIENIYYSRFKLETVS